MTVGIRISYNILQMQSYLEIFYEKKWLMIILLGSLVFSLMLVFTLNLTLAIFVLIVFSALGVFQRSFHYGLVFFLAIILIFPTINLNDNMISTGEVLTIILAIIGVISLVMSSYKLKLLSLFYYWIGLIILFIVALVFSHNEVKIFYNANKTIMNNFIIAMSVYPVIIISFQYFFQTAKRLEKFFLTMIFVGIIQSIIGIVLFSGVFHFNKSFQLDFINWSTLLAITIPITIGMLLIQKSSLSSLIFLWPKDKRKNINNIVDIVLTSNNIPSYNSKSTIVNLKKDRLNIQKLFIISLMLQILALIMAQAYIVLITIGIGIFIIGILMRNKKIILTVLASLFALAIILPGQELMLVTQLKQNILYLLSDIKYSYIWQGIDVRQGKYVSSSYLFIFSKIGLLGLMIFILGLGQYFREIRVAYLKSDEFERVWLVIILGVFTEFIFLGIFSNVFFIWPTSLLFWLLYGAVQNLKIGKKEYRLTETILKNNN